MQKIGILIDNLASSELAYHLINKINIMVRKRCDISPTIFVADVVPPIASPLCPIMHFSEAQCFDGTLIATSLSSTKKMCGLLGRGKRLYYVWNLEWVRPDQIVYFDAIKDVFWNKEIELIARNSDHAAIIKNCFNREVSTLVEDFDIEGIVKWLNEMNKQSMNTP